MHAMDHRSCHLRGFRKDGEAYRQLEKHTGMDRRDCSRSETGEGNPTVRQALRMTDARGLTLAAGQWGAARMEGAQAATIFAGIDLVVHDVSRKIAGNRRSAVELTMPACMGYGLCVRPRGAGSGIKRALLHQRDAVHPRGVVHTEAGKNPLPADRWSQATVMEHQRTGRL